MRVVLDTNIVLSGFFWDGPPRLLLEDGLPNRLFRLTSDALLAELADVLGRAKFQRRLASSPLSIDQLMDRYAASAIKVIPVSVSRIAPDPDDDVVIGTALSARADLIVTGDHGLLSVGMYEGVRIVTANDALAFLSAQKD